MFIYSTLKALTTNICLFLPCPCSLDTVIHLCVHQGQQEQVYEPKRETRGDHHIREGLGGMAKAVDTVSIVGSAERPHAGDRDVNAWHTVPAIIPGIYQLSLSFLVQSKP